MPTTPFFFVGSWNQVDDVTSVEVGVSPLLFPFFFFFSSFFPPLPPEAANFVSLGGKQ